MSPEREFIHLIANHLASAKLSTELALEILRDEKVTPPGTIEALTTALHAMEKLTQAVDTQRKLVAAKDIG